jgi:sphingomyelin phosphodiesterase 2
MVGQWWVAPDYGTFIILFGGLIILASGIVDGVIGFIFGRWEINALREFMAEMQLARKPYLEGPGAL